MRVRACIFAGIAMAYPDFAPLKILRRSQRRAMAQRSAPGAWPLPKKTRKPNRMSFRDERIIRDMAAASNSLDEIARKLNRSRKAILRKAIEMEIPFPADTWLTDVCSSTRKIEAHQQSALAGRVSMPVGTGQPKGATP